MIAEPHVSARMLSSIATPFATAVARRYLDQTSTQVSGDWSMFTTIQLVTLSTLTLMHSPAMAYGLVTVLACISATDLSPFGEWLRRRPCWAFWRDDQSTFFFTLQTINAQEQPAVLAERVRFELTERYQRSLVFKTRSLNHSDISPFNF